MTERSIRALTLGLLASTAMAVASVGPRTQHRDADDAVACARHERDRRYRAAAAVSRRRTAAGVQDQTEIIITAPKREENMQNVPISVQAIGTRRLDQLNISEFRGLHEAAAVGQLPHVAARARPPSTCAASRRGGDGNHTGSLPSVGFYLDEQPVTTIGGTLDVHIYDIARIESLAGPQGTLYGASSEAGTIRIITNKPELGVTTGRVDGELNSVAHGGMGGKLEGMINLPIASIIAFRGVAFYQRDAGYIDNVFGERTLLRRHDLGPDPDDPTQRDRRRLRAQRHPRRQCRLRQKELQHVKTWGGERR